MVAREGLTGDFHLLNSLYFYSFPYLNHNSTSELLITDSIVVQQEVLACLQLINEQVPREDYHCQWPWRKK